MTQNTITKVITTLRERYAHILGENTNPHESLENIIESIINYYEAIISCMPGNVYWLDKNGVAVGCNKNSLNMFGFKSNAEFKGLTYEVIGKAGNWPKEAIEKCIADTFEVINTGVPKSNQEEPFIPNAEGKLSHFLTNRVPILGPTQEVLGVIGISIDITQIKEMQLALEEAKEKALASKYAKSQFLAVVNHELVTPLVSILGLLDILRKVKTPASEEKNILDAIKNCTQHLLGLVNEVSDFNKIETGKYNVRYEPINLDAILYEVYGILKTLAKNKGLELRIDIGPHVPNNILTDARVLRQIVMNLVSNAIKFTEKGHITIQVKNLLQQENKAILKFSVVDTGLGIPPDKLKLIFEPFQQLEDAYTRQSSRNGTGLGLTIVELLSDLLGAKISVTSDVNKGSAFSLIGEFELCQPELKTSKKSRKKIEYQKPFKAAGFKPLVLLIEDDPIVQFIHTKMLTDLGCQVDPTAKGYEAISKFNQHDIIFVDISLPDLNGFEVIKQIRKKANGNDVPIVGLTVYKGKEEKAACIRAGANAFATKPITQNKLKTILKKHLLEKNISKIRV